MSWISETLCAGCVESKRKEITQQKKGEKKGRANRKAKKKAFQNCAIKSCTKQSAENSSCMKAKIYTFSVTFLMAF
jgi:hypothetical protein